MRSISGISEAAGQDIIDISRKFLNLLQKIHTFFVDFMNQICIIRIGEVGELSPDNGYRITYKRRRLS